MNKKWSEAEREFIRQNAGVLKDTEGAAKLSVIMGRPVSVHAWRKQRQKLGLRKSAGRSVCKLAEGEPVTSLALAPAPAPTITEVVTQDAPTIPEVTNGEPQSSCDW